MSKPIHHRLPFGLKNGRMVDISEIPKDKKGLSCDCICPQCFSPLQANKGEVNSHYFSHDPKQKAEVCEGALETAIHKMAKQIIIEAGRTIFPELIITESVTIGMATVKGSETVVLEIEHHFDSAEKEVTIGDIRPDVIAKINGESIVIEVAVTHFVDAEKRNKIKQLGLAAIEIDLSKHDRMPTKNDLIKQVITSVKNKKWLSNPKAITVREQLKARLLQEAEEKDLVYRENSAKNKERKDPPPKAQSPTLIKNIAKVKELPEFNEPVRYILCEACRHLFIVTVREVPFHFSTTTCPECDHNVSCALASTGQLPEN